MIEIGSQNLAFLKMNRKKLHLGIIENLYILDVEILTLRISRPSEIQIRLHVPVLSKVQSVGLDQCH